MFSESGDPLTGVEPLLYQKTLKSTEITLVANSNNGTAFRQIRTLYNVGTIGDLADGQVLERFTTDSGERAELAFAILVERHGPMVLTTSSDAAWDL
jgi:hypothetical protein